MILNTYLHFNGNCKEAFEFYRSVFGGEFLFIDTFANGPEDFEVPDEERDNIMHVSLPIGSSVLMGSDVPSNYGPADMGNNFSISCQTQSREQTDELFAKISEGGTVTMPPADMFWGAYFGSCKDRFGIGWQFNCEHKE